jgi:hypothetical protein
MQAGVRTARLITMACSVGVMLSLLSRVGWPVVPIGSAMLVIVVAGGARLERRRRPELWVFASTVLNIQLTITVARRAKTQRRSRTGCASRWRKRAHSD